MIDTDLTMKARSVAKCLTYNDDEELCPLCDADEQFLSSCHGASS